METMKLSKVADIIMGQSPPSSTYNTSKDGLPFFQGKTDFGAVHPEIRMYCSAPTKVAEPNDILMSVRAPVGDVNISNTQCSIGRGLAAIRAKSKIIDQQFLYFFLIQQKGNIANLGTGSIFQAINKSQLFDFPINILPFKEQEKIAYILSTLQKAIQKQEEIINTTTALKKSLLNKLFTEGTKGEPLKQTEVGMIPESWQVVSIGSLGKVVTGSTPKTSVPEYYQPADYNFIAPVDIGKNWIVENSQKKISSKGLSVSRPLPKNTVLAVCIGSTIGKVGLTSKELSATNQQINAIVCDEAVNNPWFVYYLLTFYNNLWKEAATPSPVPILTKGQFEKILIPYTDDLQEQTLMAESLKVFENKLSYHSNKKSNYECLFKTLLNELMTGTIRVNDLNFHSKTSSSKTGTA